MSEFVDLRGRGLVSNSRSWYATGGYRVGSWTPYATYASTKASFTVESGIDTAGAPALAAGATALVDGLNAAIYSSSAMQSTASVGLRWDAMTNVAVKAQFDRIKLGDKSNGRLLVFPGPQPVRNVNVVSLAVDFVF